MSELEENLKAVAMAEMKAEKLVNDARVEAQQKTVEAEHLGKEIVKKAVGEAEDEARALMEKERLLAEGKAGKIDYSPLFGNEEFFQINSEMSSYRFILEGQNFLSDGQPVRIQGD